MISFASFVIQVLPRLVLTGVESADVALDVEADGLVLVGTESICRSCSFLLHVLAHLHLHVFQRLFATHTWTLFLSRSFVPARLLMRGLKLAHDAGFEALLVLGLSFLPVVAQPSALSVSFASLAA